MKIFLPCSFLSIQKSSFFLGRILLLILLLAISLSPTSLFSQTAPLSFTLIPYSAPDIISPGRGAEQWHNGSQKINYPTADSSLQSLDVYYRFCWTQLEGATLGSYNWADFDDVIKNAIDHKQKLSFGIMSVFDHTGTVTYDNAISAYPLYIHNAMQSDSINSRDWISNGVWIPNWNSVHYLDRLRALHDALNKHILASSYKGIAFKNAIYCIDIRGYGNYGEWHNSGIVENINEYPEGRRATASTLKTIIDHHTKIFGLWPLVAMIATFDAEQYDAIMNPVEVGSYALTTSNAWGPLGWRRDQWGATDPHLDNILKYNEQKYESGPPLKDLITTRFRTSPITGEPPPYISPGGLCQYWDLERQLADYGAASMGNGNWGVSLTDCGQDNVRAAFKRSGYRLVLEGGSISSAISAGKSFSVTLNWKNTGIAPTYENWNVVYELRNDSNTIAWSAMSRFNLKRFCPPIPPSTAATPVADTFMLPANIPVGNYKLNLIIKDPTGYRDPLPLAITGRNNDGSYTIKNIIVSSINCIPPTATLDPVSTCKGQEFSLLLASATGTGPHDLVINDISYDNIAVGQTIATFNPPVQKIWNSNPAPKSHIDAPVELGVKFKSSVTGFIKGIRFFSPSNPAGTYTAHLWTTTGILVDSAAFTNVTASSWQEVLFRNPVRIMANTIYVASYHTAGGHYSGTADGLTNAVINGPLSTLDKNNSTGNGVYKYGASRNFPSTISHNSANYWVDVLFTPEAYTFDLTSVTDSNGCNNIGILQTLVVTPNECNIAPSAKISSSPFCNGQSAVVLDSATGPGPYDLVINDSIYNNIAVGQTIAIFNPPIQKIWNSNPAPASHIDAPVELGVKFKSSVTGLIKGIRFFSPNNPAGTYTAHLWTTAGTLIDSATFTNVTASNWQEVLFAAPVRVNANTIYIASYHTASGRYSGTAGGFTNEVTNGSLTMLDKVTAGGNGVYSYGASSRFPSTISSNAANYWVDVLFTPDTYTINLKSVTTNAGSTKTGDLQSLIVSSINSCDILPSAKIDGLFSCADQVVNLVLDSVTGPGPHDLVINNVTYNNINTGQTIVSFKAPVQKIWDSIPAPGNYIDAPVELGAKFKSAKNGFIKGIRFFSPNNATGTYTAHLWTTAGTLVDSATFTNVTASSWQEVLFHTPVRILANTIYIASYHTASGRYSGTTGGLTNAVTNGSLTILDKATAGGNGVYHYGVSSSFPSTISSNAANYWVDVLFSADTSYTQTFNLTSVTDNAGSTKSGALQTLSVTTITNCNFLPSAKISSPASCNYEAINLILDSASGPGPHDLIINGITYNDVVAGQTIATFDPPIQKIWDTAPPVNSHTDAPVELGAKFKSTKPGLIKGIRFFSPNNPTGSYTGHLWTTSGALIGSATFTSVTGGSWQEVLFSAPVRILANTVYIASYYTAGGRYSGTAGGLTNAVTNGSLTILDKVTAGGNGVYRYGASSSFPSTISSNAANYWVDVLFIPDTSYTQTFNLTSVTDNSGSTKTGALQTLSVTSTNCTQSRPAEPVSSVATDTLSTLSLSSDNLRVQQEDKKMYSLGQNYPNPFTNKTAIQYSVPRSARVNLCLFDMNGRLVKVLVDELKEPGTYKVNLNSRTLSGGLYFYKMQTRDFSAVRKMVIQ